MRLMFTFADIRFDSDFIEVSNQRFNTYDEAEDARNIGTMVVQVEVRSGDLGWRCIETGRIHRDTAWIRLKFWFWSGPAARWAWVHRVCRHYEKVAA